MSSQRFLQTLLIVCFILLCWLWMQAVHEAGHVLAAWLSGGSLARVVLHPLAISHTDLAENPRPLLVVWSGPLVGISLPLLVMRIARWARFPMGALAQFFAGFCLIANGAYIGLGSFDQVGDCGEMLRHGSPIWVLWLFGFTSAGGGLWLWHWLGPQLGLATAEPAEMRRAAAVCCGLLLATVVIELLLAD